MSLGYDDDTHELTAIRTNMEKDDYITVSAPSNLPGGYELNVDSDGNHWTVQVPDGGVKIGETFRGLLVNKGPIARAEFVALSTQDDTDTPSFDIPTGHWRDGICDCCTHGCCHPQFCLTMWCGHIALGQLMTRLNMDSCGKPATTRLRVLTSPFNIMLVLTFFPLYLVVPFAGLAIFIYILVVHTRTRNLLRRKYKIGTNSGCLGDFCCAYWCSAYSICQMARHTADYRNHHKARCCTETGLDEDVEPLAPLVLTAASAHIV